MCLDDSSFRMGEIKHKSLLRHVTDYYQVCLQYMGHRLEPRNEAMRRAKLLYNGNTGSLLYGSHHDSTQEYTAEVQHAAHSLSGLGQVRSRAV